MNQHKPVDKRTIKTKKTIRHAFVQLLSEKDLNDITIRELADKADINRKTFYRHYAGIYEVVDEVENEIVKDFESVLGEVDFRKDLEDPSRIFDHLTKMINRDLDFYGYLLSMRSNVSLESKLTLLLKSKTKETLYAQVPIDEKTADIALEYCMTGLIAAYRQWFNSDKQLSIEEVSEITGVLTLQGLAGLLD